MIRLGIWHVKVRENLFISSFTLPGVGRVSGTFHPKSRMITCPFPSLAITYLDLKPAVAAPPRLVFLYWSTHSLSHTHSKESLLSASLCISAHIESNVSEKTISSLTSISVSYGTRQLWAAKILSQALIHNNNELVAYDDDDYVPSTTKTL